MRSPGQFHDRFTSSFCRPLPLLVVPSDHETPSAVRGLSNKDRNSNGEPATEKGSLERKSRIRNNEGPPRAQASVSARGLTRVFEKALWLYSTSLFLCLFSLLFFFFFSSFHLSSRSFPSSVTSFRFTDACVRPPRSSSLLFRFFPEFQHGVWLCGVPRSSQTGFFVRTHCSATRPDGARKRTRRRERGKKEPLRCGHLASDNQALLAPAEKYVTRENQFQRWLLAASSTAVKPITEAFGTFVSSRLRSSAADLLFHGRRTIARTIPHDGCIKFQFYIRRVHPSLLIVDRR